MILLAGRGQYGTRSVVDQAEEYIQCAKLHPHNYKTPSILFLFSSGVTRPLKEALQTLGIIVEGVEQEVEEQTELRVQEVLQVW